MQKYTITGEKLKYMTPDKAILFEDLSFKLDSGSLLLITGPNGSGKSTLLKVILGTSPLSKGKLHSTFPKNQIAIIPQLQNMEFHLPVTLKEVIELSLNRTVEASSIIEFGLITENLLNRRWNTASGGERQRTLLTAALLRDPKLLVLDEPFNHLDSFSQKNILERIQSFLANKEKQRAVILVSHLGLEELERFGESLVRVELSAKGLAQ